MAKKSNGMTREQMVEFVRPAYNLMRLQIRVMENNNLSPNRWDFLMDYCEKKDIATFTDGVITQVVDHLDAHIQYNRMILNNVVAKGWDDGI